MSGDISVVQNTERADGRKRFAWLILGARNIFRGWTFGIFTGLFVPFFGILAVVALLLSMSSRVHYRRAHESSPPTPRRVASQVFCDLDHTFLYHLLHVNKAAFMLTDEERFRILRSAVTETMDRGQWDLITDVEIPEIGVQNGIVARAIGQSGCDGILFTDGSGVPVNQLHGPKSPLYGGPNSYLPYLYCPYMGEFGPAPNVLRSSTDSRFAVYSDGHPLGAVLDRLGTRTGLTICYEDYTERGHDEPLAPLTHTRVTVSLAAVTVWEALDALSEASGAFVWSRDADVVNVIAPACLRVPGYAANRHLRRVRFQGTWHDFATLIREWALQKAPRMLAEHPGHSGEERDVYDGPHARVELRDIPMRHFLNTVARRTGGYWYAVYRADDDVMELNMHHHVHGLATRDRRRARYDDDESQGPASPPAEMTIDWTEPALYHAWPTASPASAARTPATAAGWPVSWGVGSALAACAISCGLWWRRRRRMASWERRRRRRITAWERELRSTSVR